MKTQRVMAGVVVICLVVTTLAIAAVPGTITYQGRLTDQPGTALNGNVNIVFSIYSAASGGTALWQETQSGVPVQKGLFTVELGAVTPFSPTIFTGADLYLGVKVGTDAEMTPRQKLTSVPFAVKASVADGLSSVGMSNQIVSTVPTGTAPLQISSTTMVGNLNADLLDGQHAADIIAASGDEVRTPVSDCGSISTAGSYYLTGNITSSIGTCLTVAADNVTLDLMGFRINAGSIATGGLGIYIFGRSNVEIKNGSVYGYSGAIMAPSAIAKGIRIINVRVYGSGGTGIGLWSSKNIVKDCTVENPDGYGIYAGAFSIISGNVVSNSTGTYGIYGGISSNITGNISVYNSGHGIYGDQGSIISGNTAASNSGAGIFGYAGASIIGNTVRNNSSWGIKGYSYNLIKDNDVLLNNSSNTANEGGMFVGNKSRVVGNTLAYNSQNNIYVSQNDSVIRENHVIDSTNGIFFSTSGNYYRENTASGNTTNFNLNGTTQTDGGGNVGF